MAPTLADTDFALLNISPAPDSYKTPLQEIFLTVSPIRLKKCVGSAFTLRRKPFSTTNVTESLTIYYLNASGKLSLNT